MDDSSSFSADDVLVPSSQRHSTSSDEPRSPKRRRLNPFVLQSQSDVDEAEDYDLPSQEGHDQDEDDDDDDENDDEDAFGKNKSKYANYMHVPNYVESQRDEFFTQVQQLGSSPSAIRGPRWQKKVTISSVAFQPEDSLPALRFPVVEAIAQPKVSVNSEFQGCDEFDDDDADLLEALAADGNLDGIISTGKNTTQTLQRTANQPPKSYRQTTLFGLNTTQQASPRATQTRTHNWPMANKNEPPTHHKIDQQAMQTWVYPLNVGSIRDYQFNIVHRALFHNLLVALPTGLGKTFIAATVMLNYFRWTKDAQMVFVAPTKPLVTQQVDACFNIAGIPRSATTLLTGEVSPAVRAEDWQEKRVFFMTPQTLINDLKTGMADPKRMVLLVVDEAHKATGNYAYVEVVKFLRRFNSSFRILALTATPGASVEAVQKVIDGLDIARVEIRTEESMDIRSFVHSRDTELEIFDNSDEVETCLDLFSTAVKPVLQKIAQLNAYYSSDPKSMTLFGLMKGRERWAQSEAGKKANWGIKGMINACLSVLMGLAHNLELLKFHGIGPFYHKMKLFDDGEAGNGKYVKQIKESESYGRLMSMMRTWINTDDFIGHPKLAYLNEVVLNHFLDAGNGVGVASGRPPSDTRIMIFAHYRDSAEELTRVLNRHQPMIRAHIFVGQTSRKGSEGMDQKTQIDIIKKFKSGIYNTLVATSIGEEGLDIGEVDLIVCYDCSKSPIRMLQRMGRTGRKRAGKIVLLLMRGKEERDYYAAKDNYLKMQEIIEKGTEFTYHDDLSPRIVPRDIQPLVDKRVVDIPVENTQDVPLEPRKRKARNAKKPAKRFNMPDGVETGFTFLSGRKNKKKTPAKEPPLPPADLEDADLPHVQNVLLSPQEEDELDRRYAQIAGSQTVYVQQVRLDVYPQQIQKLCKTQMINHSAFTKSLVKAAKVMRDPVRKWNRPSMEAVMHDFGTNDTALTSQSTATSTAPTRPKSTKSRSRLAKSHEEVRTTLGSERDVPELDDDYDANDSFVDDDLENAVDVFSSSAPESSQPRKQRLVQDKKFDIPFYVSQRSECDVGSDNDELPDMGAILGSNKQANQDLRRKDALEDKPKRMAAASRKRTARRVIEEDSDE